ncbi:MAG TPA: hypothetical protein VFG62_02905 [Rhodopila sp.]|nr:hypothetical protein [Rhodopila sp.]
MIGNLLAGAAILVLTAQPVLAAGCDLSRLVGYTLVFNKVIASYIEEGKHHQGFEGCNRDRVLVFADGSGVRCVDAFLHHSDRPHGFLFARSNSDMMLCVDDDLYKVAPAN